MKNVPAEINDVFEGLKHEVTWLHVRWRFYKQLFGTSPKRIDLLNESGAAFFCVAQSVLFDEIQVMISKLTDPAKSRHGDNLTLDQLQVRIKALGDKQLTKRQRALVDKIRHKCGGIRAHRNKRLAHLDLDVALRRGAKPLPGVTRKTIDAVLSLIREYMNEVQGHYDDGGTGYEHAIIHNDGERLVELLKRGLRYEELIDTGTIARDDRTQSKWKDA